MPYPAYEKSKDDFGNNNDQRNLIESDEMESRKNELVKETIESYWNNFRKPTTGKKQYIGKIFEEMIEAIKAIDEDITAERMFELLCDDFLHLHILNKEQYSFTSQLFFDECKFNMQSLVLIALYPFYPDKDLHKIKDELLTK